MDIAMQRGTADQAIAFALSIKDDSEMRQFLSDWTSGIVATNAEYAMYWMWLRGEIAI